MRSPARLAIVVVMALSLLTSMAYAHLTGAIFTTTANGSVVNGNIYPNKDDVYLDGGPGPNAPPTAAGLPDGWYYFQVTDPPGKTLLSVDPIESRKFRVAGGHIVEVAEAQTTIRYKGKIDGTHLTGIDIDHNALTIRLMPYDNTPNNAGVYKVWATLCTDYQPGEGCFGFIPSKSKTDNFKVKGKVPPCYITIRKFNDYDADGCWDRGEPEIDGWKVTLSDTEIDPTDYYTPRCIMVCSGLYQLTEECPRTWRQTALIIDGVPQNPAIPDPWIRVGSGESHEVIFGNIELSCIKARKWYDRNANGEWNRGEPPIPGWYFELTGTDCRGNTVGPIRKYADENGEATWCDLLPGSYTVCEIVPGPEWGTVLPISRTFRLSCGEMQCVDFGNFYICTVDFDTKGYWHNKNGLAELVEADCHYVKAWTPISRRARISITATSRSTAGLPMASAFNNSSEQIAPAGSWKAEISHFLVDRNAGSDPREQLAQQLLAFIFNVRHRLGGNDGCIYVGGRWVIAGDLVQQAIDAWNGLPGTDRHAMQVLLDTLNNNSAVPCIPCDPPPVVYP